MQVIIDIDEEYYSYLRRVVFTDRIFYRPVAIIAKGKPLPKGHGRLIDESKITKCEQVGLIIKDDNIIRCFKTDAPTIIEADGGDRE